MRSLQGINVYASTTPTSKSSSSFLCYSHSSSSSSSFSCSPSTATNRQLNTESHGELIDELRVASTISQGCFSQPSTMKESQCKNDICSSIIKAHIKAAPTKPSLPRQKLLHSAFKAWLLANVRIFEAASLRSRSWIILASPPFRARASLVFRELAVAVSVTSGSPALGAWLLHKIGSNQHARWRCSRAARLKIPSC